MARFAPAACSPCAIAHAIERLFATPKTTAVRPFKSSNIKNSPRKKSIRIAGHEVPCVEVPCSSVLPVAKVSLGERNKYVVLLHHRSHDLPCSNRPAGAAKRNRIHGSDHAKPRCQADPRGYQADRQPQCHLQKRAKKIKSILDASHKLRWHLFHQAGIHGHAADTPRRSH